MGNAKELVGKDKILLIQDSSTIITLLKSILEADGILLDTVETGEEGLKKAGESPYKLILLDYNLPGISGVEVCQALKRDRKTKNIPVLFMSSADESKVHEFIKDAGAQGYIELPFEKDELIKLIKKYLRIKI